MSERNREFVPVEWRADWKTVCHVAFTEFDGMRIEIDQKECVAYIADPDGHWSSRLASRAFSDGDTLAEIQAWAESEFFVRFVPPISDSYAPKESNQ